MQQLDAPRAVWMMVPAGIVDSVIAELAPHLERDDTIIDGGNSYYVDDLRHSPISREQGIRFLDVGTSGGVLGLKRGYCMMVGGDVEAVGRLEPVFAALAPGVEAAARTPGREGDPAPEEQGWLHCGPSGSGHFVKMVHNGIEYGLMQAYAEGLNILQHANIGRHAQEIDAETTPLRDPDHYRYELDLAAVAEVWRRGSVDRVVAARSDRAGAPPRRTSTSTPDVVSDSGEGRWTVQAAVEEACRRRCSPPRCSAGSRRAAKPTGATASSPRCGRASAATSRRAASSDRDR